MKKLLGGLALAIAGGLATAACNGGGSGAGGGGAGGKVDGAECSATPTQCPAGETCWINSDATAFECEPSGAAKEGEPCAPTKGVPTCTDGFFCFKPKGSDGGVCTQLCDEGTNPCKDQKLCVLMSVTEGVATHICN